jgi:hypothetical protein
MKIQVGSTVYYLEHPEPLTVTALEDGFISMVSSDGMLYFS